MQIDRRYCRIKTVNLLKKDGFSTNIQIVKVENVKFILKNVDKSVEKVNKS